MSIDPYSKCPGGSGKKIKFCCADLVNELGRLSNLYDSEQYAACLEHLTRIEGKYPGRACLAAIKSQTLVQLGEEKSAERELAAYTAKNPNNPMALAELAILRLDAGNPIKSVELLQRAVAACEGEPPNTLIQAYLVIGVALAYDNRIGAALQHMQAGINLLRGARSEAVDDETFRRVATLFPALMGDPTLPVCLRMPEEFSLAPEGAAWKAEFDRAIEKAKSRRWLAAADQLAVLVHRFPNEPAPLFTLATLWIWLGYNDKAAGALQKYAALLDPTSHKAVDAEHLRLELLDSRENQLAPATTFNASLKDFDGAKELLSAHSSVLMREFSPQAEWNPEQPRPLFTGYFFDRPLPENAETAGVEQLPRLLGEFLLYGKSTDGPARLEGFSAPDIEGATWVEAVQACIGEQLLEPIQPALDEEDDRSAYDAFIADMVRVPNYSQPGRISEIAVEIQKCALSEIAYKRKFVALGGMTIEAAAKLPQMQARASAALYKIEDMHHAQALLVDFEALRDALGLPRRRTIKVDSLDQLAAFPADEKTHLDCAAISTFELAIDVAYMARGLGTPVMQAHALRRAAELSPTPMEEWNADLLWYWSRMQPRPEEQLPILRMALANVRSDDEIRSAMALQEIMLLLRIPDFAALGQRVKDFLKHYRQDQMAMQKFLQLMASAGLLRNDGALMIPVAPQSESSIVLPGMQSPRAESSGIWTPDAPEASSTTKKSILWTPGD